MTAEELDALGQLARDGGPGSVAAGQYRVAAAASTASDNLEQSARAAAEKAVFARWATQATTTLGPTAAAAKAAFTAAQSDGKVGHDALVALWIAYLSAQEAFDRVSGNAAVPDFRPPVRPSWATIWDQTITIRTCPAADQAVAQMLSEVGAASDAAVAALPA
jgi:hypothetical protein